MEKSRDVYMVIGGSGFLGRHIVQQLLDRGDSVCSFDIVQRHFDVPFYSGDITSLDDVSSALKNSGTTCIIHTASPPAGLKDQSLYYKVNVDGTKTVIGAAVAVGVRKLVFTSSAGVVFNGADIVNVDERLPYPEVPLDAYNDSKAKAEEAVLEANGKGGLLTVALRPAGIFGPGDRQVMTGLYQVYERNQTHFQIGDNTNLFDWTYVGNVAKSHLLAADKLDSPPPAVPLSEQQENPLLIDDVPPFTEEEEKLIREPLAYVDVTVGKHRVPTSEARPLGPYVEPPPNAKGIEAAFNDPNPLPPVRPIIRNRFDQLSSASLVRAKLRNIEANPLQVAGRAFFITNGEPCYFWDFPRLVWHQLDRHFPDHRKPRSVFKMPKSVGLTAATGAEWFGMLVGKEPAFTRFKVAFSCATRWHNIEKARRVLGYEPDVGVEEGIKRMVEWWYEEYQKGSHKQKH
ncbi:C-3 sterol dehydrogenase [Macrolepiota fuliginosa MF-IS2]|uniref:C-3 sterol dehydrogenase n=1 Tax=Macrolepiota fuliginosa MF-IS2 TaxID=1400762 RepID=A0A9P6C752_9AGAR|nr:C-3 sterol dehydrogenase [Macrolepiota fuliginosa MF-IS2]